MTCNGKQKWLVITLCVRVAVIHVCVQIVVFFVSECVCLHVLASFVDTDCNCMSSGEYMALVPTGSDMLARNHKIFQCP